MSVPDIASGARPARAPAPVATTFFVPRRTFGRIVATALVAALLFYPAYAHLSMLIGVAIAITVFAVLHTVGASRTLPWLPGLVLTACSIQWLMAAWAHYALQSHMPVPVMAVEAPEFFAYAVPATLALAAGMYAPLARYGRRARRTSWPPIAASAVLARTCEQMVVAGTLLRVVVLPFAPGSVRFAIMLLTQCAFVGALASMLLRAPRWPWHLALVLSWTFFYSSVDMQFLELLLWTAVVGLFALYRFRPRAAYVAAVSLAGVAVFASLNAFKSLHREEVRKLDLTASQRAAVSSGLIYGLLRQPSLLFAPQNVAGQVNRLNEGWFVARVIAWVPTAEPYARGETISNGLRSALLPRVLNPNKATVGGAELANRFGGLHFDPATSIGISVPGEMYANFGALGGVLGTFVYGLVIGLLFRFCVRRASYSPAWWAWVPFLLFGPLSAEQEVTAIINQITRAAVVMFIFVKFAPGWREIPRPRRGRSGVPAARADRPLPAPG